MQFWPLGVAILGAVLVMFAIMFFMIKAQRTDVPSKGPRHRRNVPKGPPDGDRP